jgi:hypothetical protein
LDGTGKLLAEYLKVLDHELEPLVRAALPARCRYVLLGESFSEPLAIRIAAHPPPGLVGLALCVTFASNPYPRFAWTGRLAAYLPLKSMSRWLCAPLMWGSASPSKALRQSERGIRHAHRVDVDGPHLLLKRPQECAVAALGFIRGIGLPA